MKGKWDAAKREALKRRSAERSSNKPAVAGQSEQRRPRYQQPVAAPDSAIQIWGVHAVAAALQNPARPLRRLWATDNAAVRLAATIAARGLRPEPVIPKDLDLKLGLDTVHQGLLLEADPLPEPDLAALAESALEKGPLLVLDQITDPHNVGAILRSSAVFGASGIVLTRRHSPPLGGALAKSASGALELVPVALVQNLARALADLKEAGVTLIGLDGAAPDLLDDVLLGDTMRGRPMALVLGAEGRGLRQSTAEACGQLCRIAGDGPIGSLNVSNAAAVALHLGAMARRLARGA